MPPSPRSTWPRLHVALALGGIVAGAGLIAAAAALLTRRVAAQTSLHASDAVFALLVDNGSLKAASIGSLRALAAAISASIGADSGGRAGPGPVGGARARSVVVVATSARISDRVPRDAALAAAGGDRDLVVREAAVRLHREEGARRFVVLPAFVGPSETVSDFVPKLLDGLRLPGARYVVARPAVDAADAADVRVATILAEHACLAFERVAPAATTVAAAAAAAAAAAESSSPSAPAPVTPSTPSLQEALASGAALVAVCDHGSPSASVAAVRDHVAAQLRSLLPPGAAGAGAADASAGAGAVQACSMERRAGAEYDFNEPTLAALLRSPCVAAARVVVVALLFISPGRHAGPGGDVATIIAEAQAERAAAGRPPVAVVMTRLLGEHPAFARVIAGRLAEALPLLEG